MAAAAQEEVKVKAQEAQEAKEDKEEKRASDDEDDDDAENEPAGGDAAAAAKKKKKKKKKKKTGASAEGAGPAGAGPAGEGGAPPAGGGAGAAGKQTWPDPSIPVRKLYDVARMPCGEITLRYMPEGVVEGSAELRAREQADALAATRSLDADRLNALRRAAEVHRTVRYWVQGWMRPGMKLIDICDAIESRVRLLVEDDLLNAGQAFPTGISVNNVAAHYTPNTGDETVLGKSDVVKIDFGVHVDGHIIDCAWTTCFDPRFDELKEAVLDATNTGVKAAGIDARLGEIGAEIQEAMESHEACFDGRRVDRVKCIRNLFGHSIAPYRIHAGKSVPIVRNSDQTKMEEGELFAIETFGSTGKGYAQDDGECSHYMKAFDAPTVAIRNPKSVKLLRHIERTRGTLAFCRKWLDQQGETKHIIALKGLVDAGVVDPIPPLVEIKGSYTAQYEHTILLRPTAKEVLSRGLDF